MPASYRFERCLGKGGFGEVYLATRTGDSDIQTQVAVKLMHRELPPEAQAIQRLRDEARALAGLNHPNILSIRELTVLDGRVALVTEYVEGQDLRDVARAGMPAAAALEACAGVGAALAEAWERLGIIHRDVKPQNIRIGRAGQVRLLDFGIAQAHAIEREARTATNLMVGSHGYTAPERYLQEDVGPESDVFSLGVTTWEALHRGRRFLPSDPNRLLGTLLGEERYEEHLDKALRGVENTEVRDLLREALAYRPGERPTAADFARRARRLARGMAGDGLAAYCEGYAWAELSSVDAELVGSEVTEGTLATQARPAVPSAPPPAPSVSTTRTGAIAAAAVAVPLLAGAAVLAIVLGAWFVSRPAADEAPPSVATAAPAPAAVPPPAAAEAAVPLPVHELEAAPAAPVPEVHEEPGPQPQPAVASNPLALPAGVRSPTKDEPAPPAPQPAHVEVETDVTVELRAADGTVFAPGEVPPGTYDLIAAWPLKARKALTLKLTEGQSAKVRCVSALQRCTRL